MDQEEESPQMKSAHSGYENSDVLHRLGTDRDIDNWSLQNRELWLPVKRPLRYA